MLNMVTAAWDIGSFLENSAAQIKEWGGLIIILVGIVMIITASVKIAMGLANHGKQQVNWFLLILLFLIGGAFSVGGYSFVSNIAEGGKKTIEDLGGGVIIVEHQLESSLWVE